MYIGPPLPRIGIRRSRGTESSLHIEACRTCGEMEREGARRVDGGNWVNEVAGEEQPAVVG